MGSGGQEAFSSERSALGLTGQRCRQSSPAIIDVLQRLHGVVRVQADVLPGHVLVDHERKLTEDELADAVNAVDELRGACRAVVMRSCITTGRHNVESTRGQ